MLNSLGPQLATCITGTWLHYFQRMQLVPSNPIFVVGPICMLPPSSRAQQRSPPPHCSCDMVHHTTTCSFHHAATTGGSALHVRSLSRSAPLAQYSNSLSPPLLSTCTVTLALTCTKPTQLGQLSKTVWWLQGTAQQHYACCCIALMS